MSNAVLYKLAIIVGFNVGLDSEMVKGKHHLNVLNVMKVKSLKEPGFYADGNGLYLKIDDNGSKRWVQRLVIQGKRRDIGMGSVHLVGLSDVRDAAQLNRKLARAGGDPLALKKKEQSIPTFESVARIVHQHNLPTWRNPKHRDQWISTLELYVFPKLGGKLISQITSTDLMAVLLPIWTEKSETAKRVHQRISTVLKWAMAQEWRADNPAENLRHVLPKIDASKVQNRPALPYSKASHAIEQVRASEAHLATKLVFEFIVLTAARSGEARLATWQEIDMKAQEWVVPAERMKAKRPHRVPLSNAAMNILEQAREMLGLSRDGDYVFPGSHGKPLTDSTLSKLLRELKIGAVPHGFRSSFRDWAAEQTHYPREVAEAALAHTVKNKVEAAYARTDHLEQRRFMMVDWANYIA